MGGDLKVESEPERGTRFVFELLVAVLHVEATSTPRQRTVVGYRGPRRKLLVVDDVPENRALLIDYLRPLGFEMGEAADGQAGLAQARAIKPDLILMDNVMPLLNGLEATRLLRRDPTIGDIPVIAVSASASQSDRDRSFAAGVDAFMHKPIDFNELLRHLATLLQLSWEFAVEGPGALPPPGATLVAPPAEQMQALHRLAMIGNMREIRQQAALIAAMDARYRPFADTLDRMAQGYESSAIRRFVEQHLAAGEAR